ncbi:MAG: hypothetical protein RBT11_07165 [Desulfobacterales bacterium]|jgi:hypothetical protein|nr:hypothetical protein [Desulfobacterales bacterium]
MMMQRNHAEKKAAGMVSRAHKSTLDYVIGIMLDKISLLSLSVFKPTDRTILNMPIMQLTGRGYS